MYSIQFASLLQLGMERDSRFQDWVKFSTRLIIEDRLRVRFIVLQPLLNEYGMS